MNDQFAVDPAPVDFWRSLRYFNFYRLTLAGLLVFVAGVFGSSLALGAHHLLLFFGSSVLYLVAVLLSVILWQLRWPRFTWQLAMQIGVDIAGL
ncbi:MAG: hypothetical protein ACYCY7_12675, partial [Gallionella sp.]